MTAWATVEQVRERVAVPDRLDDADLQRALDAASQILEALVGGSPLSTSTVQLKPCPCTTHAGWGGELYTRPGDRLADVNGYGSPGLSSRSPYYWRVGADLVVADGGCPHELVLPDSPVLAVLSIVDSDTAAVIDPAGYELLDGNVLRQTPGAARWSLRSLHITYRHGGPTLTAAALLAAAALAVEIGKDSAGLPCSLPTRVTTVTRQGISFAMLDPQTYLDGGRTGVYLVDLYLVAARTRPKRSNVLSPDRPRFDYRRTP